MRRLVPDLPASAWAMVTATGLTAAGAGLVFPFLVLYLAEARGLGPAVGGGVLAAGAATTFLASLAAGALADRMGVRAVFLAGRLLKSGGWALLATTTTGPGALAGGIVYGLGQSASFPTTQSLLATTVAPDRRSELFAVRHAGANLGFGVAAICGGLVADLDAPDTFVALLLVAAVIEVVAGAVVVLAVRSDPRPAVVAPAGYRVLLRDRALLRLLAIDAALLTVTAGQFDVVMPLAAVQLLDLEVGLVGFVFAMNTAVVVVASLIASRLIAGRSRTRALALSAALAGVAWSLLLAADAASVAVLPLFFAVAAVQAVGESVEVPSVHGMVNDLAPDALRSRYNAAHGVAFSSSTAIGPAVAGVAAGAGQLRSLLIGLVVVCALVAVLAPTLTDPEPGRS